MLRCGVLAWLVVVGCTYDTTLVPCGDKLCPTGSMCLAAGVCSFPQPDADGDLIPDAMDNCPSVANPTQVDIDRDGIYGDSMTVTEFSLTQFQPGTACPPTVFR